VPVSDTHISVFSVSRVALSGDLGGQFLCPSPMLSPLGEKGYYWGDLTRVMFSSLPYLILSILEPVTMY
jgi:hypothetical protein